MTEGSEQSSVNELAVNELAGLMPALLDIARDAGDAIMAIYNTEFDYVSKSDDSPLTEADLAAHRIICTGLEQISSWPVLSEESSQQQKNWSHRQNWQRYWLVDPLDGTKEFIGRTGEFTVNIALIDQGRALLGVVFCPTLNLIYYAAEGLGAFKMETGNEPVSIHVAEPPNTDLPANLATKGTTSVVAAGVQPDCWRVVGSRRNGTDSLARFAEQLGSVQLVNMGSSLKLCLVAEGKAHLYPRLAPTCEWDTAAAQAIVEQAGGMVLTPELESLRYGEKEDLLNPFFIVAGAMDSRWADSFRQSANSIANSR